MKAMAMRKSLRQKLNIKAVGVNSVARRRIPSCARPALAGRLAARRQRPFNPVVLSGDTHRGIVTHVHQRRNATSALVATEFVGPPVTSTSDTDYDRGADTGA
jgi:hypothetical protein